MSTHLYNASQRKLTTDFTFVNHTASVLFTPPEKHSVNIINSPGLCHKSCPISILLLCQQHTRAICFCLFIQLILF